MLAFYRFYFKTKNSNPNYRISPNSYVAEALRFYPNRDHPKGYSFFLKAYDLDTNRLSVANLKDRNAQHDKSEVIEYLYDSLMLASQINPKFRFILNQNPTYLDYHPGLF